MTTSNTDTQSLAERGGRTFLINAESTSRASHPSFAERETVALSFQVTNLTTEKLMKGEMSKQEIDRSLLVARYIGFGKAGAENQLWQYRILYEAKNDPSVDFSLFCAEVKLRDTSTIRKLLKIGENADRLLAVVDKLPSEWTTLYLLAKLEPALFDRLIVSQQVHPSVTAEELRIATSAAGRSQAKNVWVRLDLNDLKDEDRTEFMDELRELVDRYVGIALTGKGLIERTKLAFGDESPAVRSPKPLARGSL